MDLHDALAAERDATLELLAQLVAQPSTESNQGAIVACLALVRESLARYAREIVEPVHDGLPALIMRFGMADGAQRFTIAGHIDVVPVEGAWASAPFVLTRRGVRALLAAGQIDGTVAICPEPTGLDVYLGNRGIARAIVTISGRGGHSGQLHALASPLLPAARVVQALNEMTFTTRDERFTPPDPSIAVTWLAAGSQRTLNIVPDSVQIGIDRRMLPTETVEQVSAELHALLAACVQPPYTYRVTPGLVWPPCATEADHPLSQAAVRAVQASEHPVVWTCDPMHANTVKTASGVKTRHVDEILAELERFFSACWREGAWPGGVHLEFTGEDVTECLGGAEAVSEEQLSHRYESLCDPRLNARQSLDVAFRVAELMRQRDAFPAGR